jgi:hypothetical protein
MGVISLPKKAVLPLDLKQENKGFELFIIYSPSFSYLFYHQSERFDHDLHRGHVQTYHHDRHGPRVARGHPQRDVFYGSHFLHVDGHVYDRSLRERMCLKQNSEK